MNDEQFELRMEHLQINDFSEIASQLRARDTAQREALARVETELATAVRMLREIESTQIIFNAEKFELNRRLVALLARHAKAEQQEAQYISVQEAWEAAGGNPGIKADREQLLFALKTLDQVCDEAPDAQVGDERIALLERELDRERERADMAEVELQHARAALATQPAVGGAEHDQ